MSNTIKLRTYNQETWKLEDTDQEVSVHTLAHSMTTEDMAQLLGEWVSSMTFHGLSDGREVGKHLTHEHRYLQAVVIQALIGILHELGQQQHSDARNEYEVETCRLLSKWLEEHRNFYFGK